MSPAGSSCWVRRGIGEVEADLEKRGAAGALERPPFTIGCGWCGVRPDSRSASRWTNYDHVGTGEPTGGDSIWNGFVDNAAGSAMLLEIARVLSRDPRPARCCSCP